MNRFFLSFYSLTAVGSGLFLSRSLTGVAVILNYLLDLTRESTGCSRGPVPTGLHDALPVSGVTSLLILGAASLLLGQEPYI